MKKSIYQVMLVALAFCATIEAQNYTTPFKPLTILPDDVYDLILGESSGEQPYYHVMELAPYEMNRPSDEYTGDMHETKYVYSKLKEYGLPNVAVEHIGNIKTWDGVSATLWETSPKTAKLADYEDLAAFLAQGSSSADVEAQLVWIGRGTKKELDGLDLKGKIVVTEAAGSRVQTDVTELGAVGIISFYAPRPLIDPIQVPNASIRNDSKTFCFNYPPREGYVLRDRLLAGETITVHAKVKTTEIETENEITTCLIPGSDPAAGEIIIIAHLFEGYVKLGANDNNSGSAAILDVARTLNTLISNGSLPQPKRGIRFLWVPEISGTMAWLEQHKDIPSKTLCVLNLDMVGLWLSKSDGLYCFQRTPMGLPHYVNDVAEALFHYVGATNKSFLATGAGRPEPIKPIFSITGSHEPFYYAVTAHYGSSDHEMFNEYGVDVPALMFITWPDNYYHTSGDRPSILDPTQLRRAVVITAASAYAIAWADEEGALKIAAEVASNSAKRIAVVQETNAIRINNATAADLTAASKRAVFDIEAYTSTEKATLESVAELAPSSAILKKYIDAQLLNIQSISELNKKSLENLARARAEELKVTFQPVKLTAEELKASKIFPKSTGLAAEKGGGVLRTIPREIYTKHGIRPPMMFGRGMTPGQEAPTGILITNSTEIARLAITGKNSILDIKKMLDAQYPNTESLADITKYLELLKEAGYVTF
ncbi:MAG: M28 family peptidase [Tannerella sp.]|nr:M28 family peptidase [Tannerella sp.]